MATFYFNGAVDGDWQTLGNWWMDEEFTTQATALPTSADDVIALYSITSNSGGEPTVVNLTVNGVVIGVNITASGHATFYNGGIESSMVTGNATFIGSSFNSYGTVNGNATFNGSANNSGTVNGDCTFNDNSYNDTAGSIEATTVIFNGSSYNNGYISSNATFNDYSSNYGTAFNYYGTVNGDCTFNNNSSNTYSTVNGNAVFNDSSTNNNGLVNGDAVFNDSAFNIGTVNGTATFNDASYTTPGVTIGTLILGTRTPYPLRYGINNSNILGMI